MKLVIRECNGFVGKRVVKLALQQGNTVLVIDVVQRVDKSIMVCNILVEIAQDTTS